MGVRDTYAWRRARAAALRGATHCDLCKLPLDLDAPPRSKWAPSVDHIVPLARGGAPFAPSNLRVLHVSCNSRLGGRLRGRSRAPRPAPARANWW